MVMDVMLIKDDASPDYQGKLRTSIVTVTYFIIQRRIVN